MLVYGFVVTTYNPYLCIIKHLHLIDCIFNNITQSRIYKHKMEAWVNYSKTRDYHTDVNCVE